MKNTFILLLLTFCVHIHAQIINFPDANFKNALVSTKCVDLDGDFYVMGDEDADLNNDGEIDMSEALMVSKLNVSNRQISSLSGIGNFKNLKTIYCYSNQLTALNVEGLTNLLELSCFSNQLTFLNVQGLINLEYLDCWNNQLTSLNVKGLTNLITLTVFDNQLTSINVEGLINLTLLDCRDNKLTSLDAQSLTNLTSLNCYSNQLTSLNVEGLTKLTSLNCYSNQLSSLNVEGLTNLTFLYCYDNKLTSLNVEGLANLIFLRCYNNPLTSLNVEGLSNLKTLYCDSNQLNSINVKGLINLKELSCSSNQLTSLDVGDMVNLRFLNCYHNQLNYLNIKGIKIIEYLFFDMNSSLNYICCNEERIVELKQMAIRNGQLYCEVNSYCSFTPGGKFYIIKGENKYDAETSGCDDQDTKVPNIKYNITNGSISGSVISNFTGKYSIPVQEGTHTLTPILEHPSFFEVTPSSYTVTFPNNSDTITQNFCIKSKGVFNKVNITVLPLSPPARPGFEASYKIVWENVGNQIESGTLNFTYDKRLLDYTSATRTADQIADGIIKWNFVNLLPFEKREITVTLKVNRPTDSPAVNAGDKLYLSASILDNIFTLENTVVGSYDPNDKTCLQGDRIKPDMVGEYVDYLIRFENTGNYAAENVVVKDIIDTKTFDVSTLQITDASHEVYTRIEGNKVEFIFENIQLPFDDANNDGYIAFKIKTLPTLVLGDSLKNLADIYFDYNFPILTNEAKTTIAPPVFPKDINTEVSIYPNPVKDILYFESDENWTKAEVYDISGRIIRSLSLDGQSMDVSVLESGTYFARVRNGDRVGRVKFVKL